MGNLWASTATNEILGDDKTVSEPLVDGNRKVNRYRILLIGMPSSGRTSILQYIKANMNITNVRWSDATSYKELSFEYEQKHYVIILDTRGAYTRLVGSYRDYFIPLSDPMNCLHGIIFVVDANLYNDDTYDNISLYEALSDFPEFVHFAWENKMYAPDYRLRTVALQKFAKSKLFVHEVLHSVLSYKLTMEVPFLLYANKRDLIGNLKGSLLANIKENLITSRNLCNFENTLLSGMPLDVVNLIVEYVPGITDEAIARPFKVFDSVATPLDNEGKHNQIKKGFKWLVSCIDEVHNVM